MITHEVFDDQTLKQSKFEEYIDRITEPAPPEIEIDSVKDEPIPLIKFC
ncbi:hypothetical protein [Nostoc sp. MS1]|nr:hypothetical protein [Nostoc sp. MS1]BCL39171.1 hypothetical protein NSMS1_56180 [Nostoc sp. MS1]